MYSPPHLSLVRLVSPGLDYLHKEVIAAAIRPALAHRDIKSKNVLVKGDGECCIADFGLAVMYFSCGLVVLETWRGAGDGMVYSCNGEMQC